MNGPWTGSPAVWTDVPAVWGQLGDSVPSVEATTTPAVAALAVQPATTSAATAGVCGRPAVTATPRSGQPTLQVGPQTTAVPLRLGAGPAVVVIVAPQDVTAVCGTARAILVGPTGVAAPTAGPTCRTALAAVLAASGLSVAQTAAQGQAPGLRVSPGRVNGLAEEIGQVGGVGLGLGVQPVLATVGVAVTAAGLVLVAAVGAALAGTGLREVLRLASPLLRSIRRRSSFVRSVWQESPLCRKLRLGSAAAIERRE